MRDLLHRYWRIFAASVLAALALAMPAAPAVAAPCTSNCLTPGDYTITTLVGLVPRTYLVHVPASYTGGSEVPLLLDFHGGGKDAWNERGASGQLAESDRRGFISVWPNGIALVWNGYGCCLHGNALQTDDVGFARQIIAAMKLRANIDTNRVFVTGISNGGSMAHRMACEAADLVRAAVSVSFPLNTDQCRPAKPIGVTAIMGTLDDFYEGSTPTPGLPNTPLNLNYGTQPARESFAAWKRINQCSDNLSRTQLPAGTKYDGSRWEEYRECAGGVRTGLVTIANGGHVLYNGYVDPIFGHDGDAAPIDLAPWMWDNIFNL